MCVISMACRLHLITFAPKVCDNSESSKFLKRESHMFHFTLRNHVRDSAFVRKM